MGFPGLPLAFTDVGERVDVAAVAAGPDLRKRLSDLGVIVGKTLQVVQKNGTGPMVIALGDTRFALDSTMARTVLVTPSQSKEEICHDAETEAACRRRPCRRGWFR